MNAQKHELHTVAYHQVGDEEVEKVAAVTPDMAALIDERNRWYDTGDFGDALEGEVQRRAAHVVYELMLHITEKGDFTSLPGVLRLAIRALMFVWVFAPHLLADKLTGKVPSLAQMGSPLGRTRCWLSTEAEVISNKFKFFSRNQKSQRSRPNYAEGAHKGWKTRREKEEAKKKVTTVKPKSKAKPKAKRR